MAPGKTGMEEKILATARGGISRIPGAAGGPGGAKRTATVDRPIRAGSADARGSANQSSRGRYGG